MTAVYTWDVFSTLDGCGSYTEDADWGGYWGRQGPELLEHRARLLEPDQLIVFGATTFREVAEIMGDGNDPHALDEWNVRLLGKPAVVVSSTCMTLWAGQTRRSCEETPRRSSGS